MTGITSEPALEPTRETAREPASEPTGEPAPERTGEPAPEPAPEPTGEPAPERTGEPAPEPAPEPAGLRDALISAGIALLAEGGMANLTLRRAAARAGVSHAAPAHHFDGLPGLLTAIAARAFRTFADTLHTAREAAGPDPRARLLGTCQGYLTFATRHAGLFHLMFLAPQVNRSHPDLMPHATRSYQILREACLPYAKTGPDEVLEVAVWSMVHGYALLGFTVDHPNQRPFTRLPAIAELLAELLAGRTPSATGPRDNPTNPLAPAAQLR